MTGFKGSERDKPLFFSLPDLLIQGDLWRFIRWCRLTHTNTHTANQNTTNTIFPFCSVASLEEMLKHEYAGNIFSWASTSGCEGNSRDEGTFKPSSVCVCKTVWLSYFCKLQWAAGLAAPVFPRGLKGEYWLSCFVIQMPNVPPAKQLPPVTVLNRAALSLSRSSSSLSSSPLFTAPFRSRLIFPLRLLSSSLPLLIFIFSSKSAWIYFLLWPCPFYYRPLLSSPSFILFPVSPSFSSCSLSFASFSRCVASLSLFAFSRGKLEKDKGHKEYDPINIRRLKENRRKSPMSLELRKFNEGATFVQCKSCPLKSVSLEKRLFAVHRENTDIHLFHCPAGIHTTKVSPRPFFSFYWAVFRTEMPNVLSSFQRYWLNKTSCVIILKCCFL